MAQMPQSSRFRGGGKAFTSRFVRQVGSGASRIAEFMRISEVPRPVLIALVALLFIAAALGIILHVSAGSSVGLHDLAALALSEVPSPPGFDAGSGALGFDSAESGGEQDALSQQGEAPEYSLASDHASASTDSASGASSSADSESAPLDTLVVDVGGAVSAPGVYTLEQGSRVVDALHAAGGALSDANLDAINMASVLTDGMKVVVPRFGEEAPDSSQAAPYGAGSTPSTGGLININTAGADELKTLPGVGDSTAAAILDERERNGPFASPEDIMRVSGIGEKKFARMQGLICT